MIISPDRPVEEDEAEAETFQNAEYIFKKNKNVKRANWLKNTIALETTTTSSDSANNNTITANTTDTDTDTATTTTNSQSFTSGGRGTVEVKNKPKKTTKA